jgi:hypothetical protein
VASIKQLKQLHTWFALSLVLKLTVASHAAEDQNTDQNGALAAAEQAYQRVDPQATYEAACGALQRGRATFQQALRLHVLCGVSAATLGKEDEARAHFVVALALQPDIRLGQELSPKTRSPYLEAQGMWAGTGARLLLRSVKREDPTGLRFTVIDPMHLSAKVNLYIRQLGNARFRLIEAQTSATVTVSLPSDLIGRPLQHYAVLVDANDNVLAELGSSADPLMVPQLRPRDSRRRPGTAPVAQFTEPVQTRSLWLPITLFTSGALSAGAGVYFNLQRENAAAKWNGSDCEQPGQTRLDQCAGVNADRASAERAAIALYAAGGLLMTTGLTFLLLDSGERRPNPSTRGAAGLAVSCGAGWSLAQLACSGRF